MMKKDLGKEFVEDREAIKRGFDDFLRSLSRLESAIIIKAGATIVSLIVLGVVLHFLFRITTPELEAKVLANTSTKVGTFILVNNLGSSDWNQVKMTLNQRYTYQVDKIEAGGRLTIMAESFTEHGKPAPNNLIPMVLSIECDKGTSIFPLK